MFLGNVLSGLDLGNVDQNSLILAVDEVCANIIIHSNCDEGESIEMTVILSENKIIFEIIDGASNGFDINAYDAPELQEIIKTRRKGGIGLMLVKKIMDKIEVKQVNGKNCCRLYKSIN